jgi:hypothetical protein
MFWKRERGGGERHVVLNEIDLTEMPRDVWHLVSRFLSLKDLKNLSRVNRVLLHRMRVLMMSRFRFVVPGTLSDFIALGWTQACLNIRLTLAESVLELSEKDLFLDIVIPDDFNESLENVTWPSRLTHLTFGVYFNQSVNRLPASLTHLTFGWAFAQPVNHLPASLTYLKFGSYFNQPVNRLPASLTHLTFGWAFAQPVDHLPASLTYLKFGSNFNQLVDHLPACLTHLTFGWDFNQPVDRLPASLTHLEFGGRFHQPVDRLPVFLKRIYLYSEAQICLFVPEYRHLIEIR